MATETLAPLASAGLEVSPTPSGELGAGPAAKRAGAGASASMRAAPMRAAPDPQIALDPGPHRDEIIKRLRRAEGQLRGIVRMLEEGQGCLPISQQLTAVRKALDATMARMTMNYLQQEMADAADRNPEVGRALERVGLLVARLG